MSSFFNSVVVHLQTKTATVQQNTEQFTSQTNILFGSYYKCTNLKIVGNYFVKTPSVKNFENILLLIFIYTDIGICFIYFMQAGWSNIASLFRKKAHCCLSGIFLEVHCQIFFYICLATHACGLWSTLDKAFIFKKSQDP